jgi:hypothetical protein
VKGRETYNGVNWGRHGAGASGTRMPFIGFAWTSQPVEKKTTTSSRTIQEDEEAKAKKKNRRRGGRRRRLVVRGRACSQTGVVGA